MRVKFGSLCRHIISRRHSYFLILLALLSTFITTADARADLITWQFAGPVTSLDSGIAGTFNSSQTLSGSFSFETSTPDSDPRPRVGMYSDAVKSLSFMVGNYSGTLSGGNFINVTTPNESFPFGEFFVAAQFAGARADGNSPFIFQIQLQGEPQLFPTDALPSIPPSLQSLSLAQALVVFNGPPIAQRVFANVTSLTAIRESSTVVLLSLGFTGLMIRRLLS